MGRSTFVPLPHRQRLNKTLLFYDLLVIPRARKKPTRALAEREIEARRDPGYWGKRSPWD